MTLDCNGDVFYYANSIQAYQGVICKLFANFPRGYIDLPLFMHDEQGVAICDAKRLCKRKELYYLPIYDIEAPYRKEKLRAILTTLLQVSGLDFDEASFNEALYNTDKWIINCKIKERVLDGSIFQFLTYEENINENGKKDFYRTKRNSKQQSSEY